MPVGLTLSAEQVRYYALSALHGFDDLDAETATLNAKSELTGLLNYLDALAPTDNAVPVFGLRIVDGPARLERIGCNAQIDDPADFEIVRV